MTRFRSLMLLACAAGAIGLSVPANAAQTFSGGGLCQPRKATNSAQYTNYGFVNNGTTAAITAECPFSPTVVLRGCHAFSEVVVYDRNPSKNVTCTVKAIKINGDISLSITKNSAGASASFQSLGFGFSNLASDVIALHMTCSVPPRTSTGLSAITMYSLLPTCP